MFMADPFDEIIGTIVIITPLNTTLAVGSWFVGRALGGGADSVYMGAKARKCG
jgi:hypothetical protein